MEDKNIKLQFLKELFFKEETVSRMIDVACHNRISQGKPAIPMTIKIKADLIEAFLKDESLECLIPIVSETFSMEEMKQILAIYSLDCMKKLLNSWNKFYPQFNEKLVSTINNM